MVPPAGHAPTEPIGSLFTRSGCGHACPRAMCQPMKPWFHFQQGAAMPPVGYVPTFLGVNPGVHFWCGHALRLAGALLSLDAPHNQPISSSGVSVTPEGHHSRGSEKTSLPRLWRKGFAGRPGFYAVTGARDKSNQRCRWSPPQSAFPCKVFMNPLPSRRF